MTLSVDARRDPRIRTYDRQESVVFLKTNEEFGGLSNMAGGFPLVVNGVNIRSSEALYQACRFPHMPEVQRLIIAQASPMTAKMKSKPYRQSSRPDWDRVRVKVMRWCLRVKLAQNWNKFSQLLLATGDRPIVEESRKDSFWGAYPVDRQSLVGVNVLGRLLMELREEIRNSQDIGKLLCVEPLPIPEFLLNSQPIGLVTDSEVLSRNIPWDSKPPAASVLREGAVQEYLFGSAALATSGNGESGEVERSASIHDLKPYPGYKDSGVPWLGKIPAHWDLRRTKTLLRERSEKGFPDEPLLAATQTKGVVRKEQYENRTVLALKDLHLLKLVRVGDFVISLRSFQGGIEYAREQGIISPAYTILYPVQQEAHDFSAWLFKSKPYVENLSLFVTGIRQGQNIDYQKLSRSELPYPPLPEQSAIVRFLEYTDRRIRRYIRTKKKLIALLNEQKQVITQSAVTRGLDPNVRLKPSGVAWLGDVPEHWEVKRLKSLVTEAVAGPYGSSLTKVMYSPRGYRVYGQQQVIADDFSVGDYYISEDKFADMAQYRVFANDVLVSVMGTVGRVAVVPESAEPGIINPRLVRYRPDFKKIRARYLQLAMQATPSQAQLAEGAKGTTMEGLNMQILGNLLIPVPPLYEQDAILINSSSEAQRLLSGISCTQREIDLIREYRTRLIADIVTGKLDVREAAARLPLPAEAEEPELLDEGESLAQDEEEVDGADDDASEEAVA